SVPPLPVVPEERAPHAHDSPWVGRWQRLILLCIVEVPRCCTCGPRCVCCSCSRAHRPQEEPCHPCSPPAAAASTWRLAATASCTVTTATGAARCTARSTSALAATSWTRCGRNWSRSSTGRRATDEQGTHRGFRNQPAGHAPGCADDG